MKQLFLVLLIALLPMAQSYASTQSLNDTRMNKKQPKDPDQLAALGTDCLRRGDIAGAEYYYNLGFQQKRITTTIISLAGDIALAKNDREKADYYYGRAIYFDPRDSIGYMHYVRMHQQKEPALAVEKLQQLALYRDDCRVDHHIAAVWYAGNKVKEAIAAYDSIHIDSLSRDELVQYSMSAYLLRDYQKSTDIVSHGRQQYPRDFILNRLLMYNYTELKQYEQALQASVDFFQHSDLRTDTTAAKGYTYLDYIYYGYILNGNGQYEEGIVQFNKALALDGGNRHDVILSISKAYENIGQYPKAVEYYKSYMQQLDEKERTAYVVYELGRLYYAQGTDRTVTEELTPEKIEALNQADNTFAEVDRLRPDSYLGCYWRARTNVALDPETTKGLAKPFYQRVIEMTESKGGSQLLEAYKYLAYYYYVKKDKELAMKYVDKILDIDPMDSYALKLSAAI